MITEIANLIFFPVCVVWQFAVFFIGWMVGGLWFLRDRALEKQYLLILLPEETEYWFDVTVKVLDIVTRKLCLFLFIILPIPSSFTNKLRKGYGQMTESLFI